MLIWWKTEYGGAVAINTSKFFYIKKRIIWNAICVFSVAVPAALLLLVVALCFDLYTGDALLSLWVFLFAIAVYILSLAVIPLFLRTIDNQERLFCVIFPSEGLEPVGAGPLDYASAEWYVRAGSLAFYRDYVTSIKYKCVTHLGPRANGYRAVITTVDGKTWVLSFRSSADINRLCAWKYGVGDSFLSAQ